MKKIVVLLSAAFFFTLSVFAQDDVNSLHTTAKTFMRSGDFDNAILVLNRALQQDSKSLELQKDLAQCFYLKRDYEKALTGVKELIERSIGAGKRLRQDV
jgi:thioredoxin-like negative regulator of GroEL